MYLNYLFCYQLRETFSTEIFHSIETFIQRCTEMMRMDKKLSRLWAKRMHISLKCYKENLVNLFALEKKLSAFNNSAKQTNVNNASNTEAVNSNEEIALVELAESLMNEKPSESSQQNKEAGADEPKSLLDERTNYLLTKLKNQIFNIQEFRELFIVLLKDFDQSKMTK